MYITRRLRLVRRLLQEMTGTIQVLAMNTLSTGDRTRYMQEICNLHTYALLQSAKKEDNKKERFLSESASKKRKVNDVVEDYFQKSIQLKEEKERNAQKRHEEKMAYLEKIESFMTKMFKK
ncbi:hypothetical protein RN001_002675 [Aquatica leii]|uniref:Uncharacterized protein n=1 Tax=Aquatica leii TaxID=1421715 RepID=A0AAN7PH77_9COLE|nr:hypothetical protein RN001_002675 [Aquatica leii]